MSARDDKTIQELLRRAIAPVNNSELRRDLWPQMLQRLEQPAVSVPWYDWALLALLTLFCLSFPELIPVLLYHF